MINRFKKFSLLFLAFLLILNTGCTIVNLNKGSKNAPIEKVENNTDELDLKEGEYYYEVNEVSAYIHMFGKLPPNYITKSEAKKIGWSVEDKSEFVIGGDKFQNREGLLPEEKGRVYYEADISSGYSKNRGPLRLVFSNDGLIFYTEDHYESYIQLY